MSCQLLSLLGRAPRRESSGLLPKSSRGSRGGAVVLLNPWEEIHEKSSRGAVGGFLRGSPAGESYSGVLPVAWFFGMRQGLILSPLEKSLMEEM